MMLRPSLFVAAAAAVLVSACATTAPPAPPPPVAEAPPPPPAPPKPKAQVGEFGFDVSGMDASAAAGDDFFRHSVGKWVDRTEIPADRSNITAFAVIGEKASERTRARRCARAAMPKVLSACSATLFSTNI